MKLFAIAIWGSVGLGALAVGCSVKVNGVVPDGGASTDAGKVTTKDGATADAPPPPDKCTPDLAGYSDGTYHPAGRVVEACTPEQLSAAYDACWATTATADGCEAWYTADANLNCDACMSVPDTNDKWGAYVYKADNSQITNTAGCLELKGIASSCAGAYANADACQEFACKPCYDDAGTAGSDQGEKISDAEWDNYSKCWDGAASGVCASRWAESDKCLGLKTPQDTTPELTACVFPNTNDEKVYKAFFVSFTGLFCGK